MGSENKLPLLEKVYYEDCPGCKIEKRKDTQQDVPWSTLISIWVVVLCNALPISSLFPFLYFMIKDFNIAKEDADVGYYAGFVGCAFMLGRALTSVLWGMIADRYGRKPVIIFGTVALQNVFQIDLSIDLDSKSTEKRTKTSKNRLTPLVVAVGCCSSAVG